MHAINLEPNLGSWHGPMVLLWNGRTDEWQVMSESKFKGIFNENGTHAETKKNLADYLHTLFLAMKNEKDYKKRVDQSASIFKILDEYGVEAPMHLRSGLVAFIANEHWKLNRWSRSRGPGKGDYIAFVQVDTANPEAEEPSYYLVQYSETLPEYEMSQGFRGSAEIKRNWRLMDRSLLQQYHGHLDLIMEQEYEEYKQFAENIMRLEDDLEIVLQIKKLAHATDAFFHLLSSTPYKKQLSSNEKKHQHNIYFINADTHEEIARLELAAGKQPLLIFPE